MSNVFKNKTSFEQYNCICALETLRHMKAQEYNDYSCKS